MIELLLPAETAPVIWGSGSPSARGLGLLDVGWPAPASCDGDSPQAASMDAATIATRTPTIARQLIRIRCVPPIPILAAITGKGSADRPWPRAARTGPRCAAPRTAPRRTREKPAEKPDHSSAWRSTMHSEECAVNAALR